MDPGGADGYEDLVVLITAGRDPSLLIYEEDGAAEKVDLTSFESAASIHAYLRSRGFVYNASIGNRHSSCFVWASEGECVKNPEKMRETCRKACADLRDRHAECAEFAQQDKCATHKDFMQTQCPVSCGWKLEL